MDLPATKKIVSLENKRNTYSTDIQRKHRYLSFKMILNGLTLNGSIEHSFVK